jgi:hypothetical protein
MKPNVYNARNEVREERKRQALAAGLMSARFPDVSSIVVTMNYGKGTHSAVLRTLNFYPDSSAFFRISCLSEGCDQGALDLTHSLRRMIGGRETTAKGELCCDNKDAAIVHPKVEYQVAITYS